MYASARGEPGRCALIIAEGAQLTFADEGGAEQLREQLAEYERVTAPTRTPAPPDAIERALAKLDAIAGGDGLRILHRIDPDTIYAIESEEDDFELDDDMLQPDDPRAAYAAALAEREAARADRPTFGLVLDQSGPTRTYDAATAIAELSPGESRVIRSQDSMRGKAEQAARTNKRGLGGASLGRMGRIGQRWGSGSAANVSPATFGRREERERELERRARRRQQRIAFVRDDGLGANERRWREPVGIVVRFPRLDFELKRQRGTLGRVAAARLVHDKFDRPWLEPQADDQAARHRQFVEPRIEQCDVLPNAHHGAG